MKTWAALIFSVVLVSALWGGSFYIVSRVLPGQSSGAANDEKETASLSDYGVLGDSFGAVNALFSGLALVGVVFALLLQHEDLAVQREEMRESLDVQRSAAQMQGLQARIAADAEMLRAIPEMTKHLSETSKKRNGAYSQEEINASPANQIPDYQALVPEIVNDLQTCLEELERLRKGRDENA